MSDPPKEASLGRSAGVMLLLAVFVAAICGLVYELIAGTLSSYLLGDSVTQFSLVIGFFLTAMGVGSYLSKFVSRNLIAFFIGVEIAIGLIGGVTALVGFAAFALTELYQPILLGLVVVVGALVGLEIPLVVRILRQMQSLRVSLANVLSADYVGALAASIVFPFALLPHLGLVRAGMVIGLANVAVAGLFLWRFESIVGRSARRLKTVALASGLLLAGGAVASGRLVSYFESRLYQDEIILALRTPHQRLVITRWRDDVRLYLDGHLQFSSVDEYRYHEALVHPAMSLAGRREHVLILGGGDGLAAREVVKYPDVGSVEIVDIDPVVTNLFRDNPMLRALNNEILSDSRVTVHNLDAMRFLQETDRLYDVIIMDLPDPSAPGLGKLYSTTFFGLIGHSLTSDGMLAAQCTSPFRSREAYWCIINTIEAVKWGPGVNDRFHARPYHTVVPTFGTWGFVVAGRHPPDVEDVVLRVPARYLSDDLLQTLFVFPPDMARVETPISTLDDPVVCRLYSQGYHKYLD